MGGATVLGGVSAGFLLIWLVKNDGSVKLLVNDSKEVDNCENGFVIELIVFCRFDVIDFTKFVEKFFTRFSALPPYKDCKLEEIEVMLAPNCVIELNALNKSLGIGNMFSIF